MIIMMVMIITFWARFSDGRCYEEYTQARPSANLKLCVSQPIR